MANLGMKISEENVDVKIGSDEQMVITSKYSTLKGSLSGSGTVVVPQTGVTQTVTIPHGLPNIPIAQAYWNDRDGDFFDPGDYYFMPAYIFGFGGTDFYFVVRSDATNVYLDFAADDFGSGGASIDIRYSYYIFIDKARL